MGAQKPTRPAPGHSMLLPRVSQDDDMQRALQHVAPAMQRVLAIATAAQDAVAAAPGQYLGAQALTGGGTGTLAEGTCVVEYWIQAAGGGGGGAAGGANDASGAGGGSGMCLYGILGTPGTPLPSTFTYSAPTGAAAGGTSGGTAGSTGADASLTIAGATITAKGGTGGAGMSSSTIANAAGGVPQAGSTSGGSVIAAIGARGQPAYLLQGTPGIASISGDGASSPFGVGGFAAIGAFAAGGAAQGFGAGGGGANANGAGFAGGDGAPALIFFKQYS